MEQESKKVKGDFKVFVLKNGSCYQLRRRKTLSGKLQGRGDHVKFENLNKNKRNPNPGIQHMCGKQDSLLATGRDYVTQKPTSYSAGFHYFLAYEEISETTIRYHDPGHPGKGF